MDNNELYRGCASYLKMLLDDLPDTKRNTHLHCLVTELNNRLSAAAWKQASAAPKTERPTAVKIKRYNICDDMYGILHKGVFKGATEVIENHTIAFYKEV